MALNYQYICRTPSQIPAEAYSRLRREIGEGIGRPFRQLFPRFAQSFSRTTEALDQFWPMPIVCCETWRNDWLVTAVSERNDQNLFINLVIASAPIDGEDFETSHRMLPVRWLDLYREFESFVITEAQQMPLQWKNTPSSFPGRMSLEEFRQQIGAKRSESRFLAMSAGANPDFFDCWLWSDAGDALFIDATKQDKRVFHIRGNNLTDFAVLADPGETLDMYLAHIVSGKSPDAFDFRK